MEERVAERRRRETDTRLDRVRDLEGAEHRVERRAPRLDRRRDERDALRRDAAADQRRQLVPDKLERAAHSRAFEEANPVAELGRRRWRLLEERALEMRERGMRVLGAARAELLDSSARERGQIFRGPVERRERDAARLVRQRDLDLRPPRERAEERPLGARQVPE